MCDLLSRADLSAEERTQSLGKPQTGLSWNKNALSNQHPVGRYVFGDVIKMDWRLRNAFTTKHSLLDDVNESL